MAKGARQKCLQAVARYVWRDGDRTVFIDALDFWPVFPGIQVIDGRRYIVRAEEFNEWPLPDSELLECGHIQPIRTNRRGKYFNRKRRCDQCAREAFIRSVEAA